MGGAIQGLDLGLNKRNRRKPGGCFPFSSWIPKTWVPATCSLMPWCLPGLPRAVPSNHEAEWPLPPLHSFFSSIWLQQWEKYLIQVFTTLSHFEKGCNKTLWIDSFGHTLGHGTVGSCDKRCVQFLEETVKLFTKWLYHSNDYQQLLPVWYICIEHHLMLSAF